MNDMSHPELPPHTIPTQRPGFTLEKSPCCVYLKSDNSERLIKMNETSALIWQICTGEWSVGEIIAVLKESYPDAADAMEADVFRTLGLLVEDGIINLGNL